MNCHLIGEKKGRISLYIFDRNVVKTREVVEEAPMMEQPMTATSHWKSQPAKEAEWAER